MNTKIAIKEANGEISTSKWVNDETPLNADNMNVLLDGVRDNLKNIDEINSSVENLRDRAGKTDYSLKIKYNELVNGVIEEREVSFNGSEDKEVDLLGIAGTGGGDLPLSAAPETGMIFINNTLKWDPDKQEIDGLVLILDGGGVETIQLENSYAVVSIQQDISVDSNNLWGISADANTGLEFRQGVLMWSADELIPDLFFIMDGGTSANI